MAQVVERSLPTPEVPISNAVIANLIDTVNFSLHFIPFAQVMGSFIAKKQCNE